MNPDFINGLFELVGGLFLLANVRRLHCDKEIRGVSWLPTAFFATWGMFNLWFYDAVGLPWSWFGGLFVVAANAAWLVLLAYYSWRRSKTLEVDAT